MREDAGDLAEIQASEASTITSLVNAGFIPETVVRAVAGNDMTLLRHSGLTSVQLVPPSSGAEPLPGFSPGQAGPPLPVPATANGNGNGARR